MATHYVVRHQSKRIASHIANRQHTMWAVFWVSIAAVVVGLLVSLQSLAHQNAELRGQYAELRAQRPIVLSTCKLTGDWTGGTTKQWSVPTPNGERHFLIHLPTSFSAKRSYPLVLFYPGKGMDAHSAELKYGMDNLPAVVVYPFPTIGTDGDNAWESAPYSSNADDVAFTTAILDRIDRDMCINQKRVYATGYSNGGAFASLLSCELPGRFAAYAVVSGALYEPDGSCRPPKPAPLLNVHGDDDGVIPYGGSLIRRLPHVDSWVGMRAAAERCDRPVSTRPELSVEITTWGKCRHGGIVQNIRIIGGDHDYGQIPNQTLWQFLSRFTL